MSCIRIFGSDPRQIMVLLMLYNMGITSMVVLEKEVLGNVTLLIMGMPWILTTAVALMQTAISSLENFSKAVEKFMITLKNEALVGS